MDLLKLPNITENDVKNIIENINAEKVITEKLDSYSDFIYDEVYGSLERKGFKEDDLIKSSKKYYLLKREYNDCHNWIQSLFIGILLFAFEILTFLSVIINGMEIQNSWLVFVILIISIYYMYSGIVKCIRKKIAIKMINAIEEEIQKIKK